MEQKELVLMIGERYTGRDVLAEKKWGSGDASVIRLGGRSLHWGCKRVRGGCGDKQRVVVDDEVCTGMGARRSLIEAGRDGGAKVVKGVLVEPAGGETRRMWEREWERAATDTCPPKENRDLDYESPCITEGFDVIQRASARLHTPHSLSTIGLLLDAAILITPEGLRPGISNLLHAWYTIPSSPKVLIIALNQHYLMQKGACSEASLSSMLASLEQGLAALRAPYPIYLYASLTGGAQGGTLSDCVASGAVPASLAPSDIAYLQRKHHLSLEYLHVVSSTSLLGSGAERLRQVSRSLGMRYVDANALLSSVSSGADIHEVLKKISEKTKCQKFEFISQGTADPPCRYPFLGTDAAEGNYQVVVPRGSSSATVHKLIMSTKSAVAFTTSLPAPAAGRATTLTEDYVLDYFGSQQVMRGTKFFRKNMVDLLTWDGASSEARLCCSSADLTKQYSVLFKLNAPFESLTINGVNCECEKEVQDGVSKCRHAAGCAMYLAVKGLPIEDEDSDTEDEQPPPVQEVPSVPVQEAVMQTSILDHIDRVEVLKLPELLPAAAGVLKGVEPKAKPKGKKSDEKRTLPVSMRASAVKEKKVPKGKGAKKRMYPNAPKRPLTAYFFFLKEEREKVVGENPGVSAAVLTKIQGGVWGGLSEEEKEKYKQMAKEDRERYEEEMKVYRETEEFKNAEPVEKPVKTKAKPKPKGKTKEVKRKREEGGDEEAAFYARFQRNSSWRLGEGGKWVHEWDDADDDLIGMEVEEVVAGSVEAQAPIRPLTPPCEPFGTYDEEAELTVKKQSTAATTSSKRQSTKTRSDLSDLNLMTEKSGLAEVEELFFGNRKKKQKKS